MKPASFFLAGLLGALLLAGPTLTASSEPSAAAQPAAEPANLPASTTTIKSATPEDSATKRLLAMQKMLQSALDNLKKAPLNTDSAGNFVELTITDVKEALDNVAKGLAYVKTHPESERLVKRPVGAEWPTQPMKNGSGVVGTASVSGTYPTLQAAQESLQKSLLPFLMGNSTTGYLIMNDLGGYRDKILRSTDTAFSHLVKGVVDFSRRGNTRYAGQSQPASSATHAPDGKGGSIAGRVVDNHGQPAAFAAISIHLLSEMPTRRGVPATNPSFYINAEFPGGVLVTVTDANGAFTIKDLTPESYVVTAESTNGTDQQTVTHPPVEVKAGVETKIAEPLTMFNLGRGVGT